MDGEEKNDALNGFINPDLKAVKGKIPSLLFRE